MVCLPLQMGSPSLLAYVLCPKRLTCREYGLLALPSSQLGSANRRHQHNIRAQAVSVFLLGRQHRELSRFQCLLHPLPVITCLGLLPSAWGDNSFSALTAQGHCSIPCGFPLTLPTTVYTCVGQLFICFLEEL